MTTEKTNAALLRGIYEAYAHGDADPLFDALDEDVRFGINARRLPVGGVSRGIPWSKEVIGKINEHYQWVEFACFEIICKGDRAVALTSGRIKHRESGAVVDIDLVDVVRFRDGKIVEFIEYFDTGYLKAQQDGATWLQEQRAVAPAREPLVAPASRAKAKAKPKAKAKAKQARPKQAGPKQAGPKQAGPKQAKPTPKAKRRPARRRR